MNLAPCQPLDHRGGSSYKLAVTQLVGVEWRSEQHGSWILPSLLHPSINQHREPINPEDGVT